MNYRKGSMGAGIKRHSKLIESELKTGKSQAEVRRQMIEQNLIGSVTPAYFNQVLADLGIGKNAAKTAAPVTISAREQMHVDRARQSHHAQDGESAEEANASTNRITTAFVDPRFSTDLGGGAK